MNWAYYTSDQLMFVHRSRRHYCRGYCTKQPCMLIIAPGSCDQVLRTMPVPSASTSLVFDANNNLPVLCSHCLVQAVSYLVQCIVAVSSSLRISDKWAATASNNRYQQWCAFVRKGGMFKVLPSRWEATEMEPRQIFPFHATYKPNNAAADKISPQC